MKQFYWTMAGLLLLCIASCSSRGNQVPKSQTVKIDTVTSAGEQSVMQFPGKVKAAQDVSLAFRVSGTIHRLPVSEGTHVRQGQLLAELDPTDYQIQLDATEAEYQQIKAEAERVIALYNDNGTTPNAYDKAVYGLKQITAKRKHHQDQLAYTRLYAPFSGIVQKCLFETHETVGAGMPVVSMIGNATPEVEINLPAAEFIRRDAFDSYHCTFDIYPGKVYPLKFISITPKANSNQLYTMRLQLASEGLPLPSPGMNAMVSIICKSSESNLLAIPATAILKRGEKTFVFVYQDSQKNLALREVELARLQSDGSAIVTSQQLRAGDVIVASGVHHLEEGELVRPLPAPSPTNVGGML